MTTSFVAEFSCCVSRLQRTTPFSDSYITLFDYGSQCAGKCWSVQARVIRRGHVFRDYGLLPGRLPGAHG